jgi:hypothetical protein
LSADGQHWQAAKNPNFLIPVRALSLIFRAKIRDGLQKTGVLKQVPAEVWKQPWVVHAQPAGSSQKVLDYLGRYVFRIAITQSRLESLAEGQVTFRYRDNRTQEVKHLRLSVAEFIQRFLQHVLPKGMAKVRHYGLDSSACGPRHLAALALLQLLAGPSTPPSRCLPPTASQPMAQADSIFRCPNCGIGRLVWLAQLLPSKKIPP